MCIRDRFKTIYVHYYDIVSYIFCSFAFSTYSVCYCLLLPKVQAVIPKSIVKPLKITAFVICLGYIIDILSWIIVSSTWYLSKPGKYLHILTEILLLLPIFLENLPLLVIISLLNHKSTYEEQISDISSQRSCDISLVEVL